MAEGARVWLVDDDRSVRVGLAAALAEAGFRVTAFADAREALHALATQPPPALVVTDVRMPGDSGLLLLERLKDALPALPVIVMSAHTDVASTAGAFRGGAHEFLSKPFDLDAAVAAVRLALPEQAARAPSAAPEPARPLPELVGDSPAMRALFRSIGRLAQAPLSVLITGETGTGKELVARALHDESPRAAQPFVALNTAAIPAELLESELFGHEAGAFTGAQRRHIGRFEQADGGTLFLDEIGDMPAELQTRLLRVLSDGHFYRVGGQQPIRANVRVIAATHQDLEERVRQGLFREDLFHRLNVIRLRLPPLRERHEDIPLLVRHFLQKSAQELGVERKRISDATLEYLQSQPFPGNVRQLENLCHWLTVMAPAQVVEVADLPPEMREQPGRESPSNWMEGLGSEADRLIASRPGEVFDRLTREFERTLIRRALAATGGRRIEAAQLLGIGRNTISRKIQELGMDDERTPEAEESGR